MTELELVLMSLAGTLLLLKMLALIFSLIDYHHEQARAAQSAKASTPTEGTGSSNS